MLLYFVVKSHSETKGVIMTSDQIAMIWFALGFLFPSLFFARQFSRLRRKENPSHGDVFHMKNNGYCAALFFFGALLSITTFIFRFY